MPLREELSDLSADELMQKYDAWHDRIRFEGSAAEGEFQHREARYLGLAALSEHALAGFGRKIGVEVPDDMKDADPRIRNFDLGALAIIRTLVRQAEDFPTWPLLQRELDLPPTELIAAYDARQSRAGNKDFVTELELNGELDEHVDQYYGLVMLTVYAVACFAQEQGGELPLEAADADPEILAFSTGALTITQTLIQVAEAQALRQRFGE